MEKLVPDPSLKKQIWAYPRINSLKTYSLLLLYVQVQVEEYQNTLRPRVQQHLLSLNTSYKAFLKKQKEDWNKSRFPIICMVFEEKYVSAYVLLTLLVLGWFVRLFMLRGGANMPYPSIFCFKHPMKLKLDMDDHHHNWSWVTDFCDL